VIDESGSHLLINHVLRKLLETERLDSQQRGTDVTQQNYNFISLESTTDNGRRLYVLTVEPKVKNKLLYHGKIFVDAEDYAVVKIEAEPAENPSFWIKNTEIHARYAKNGEFWLPEENRSESKTRLGGAATLTIDYGTYHFQEQGDVSSVGAGVH
jgi:hypothetical protein